MKSKMLIVAALAFAGLIAPVVAQDTKKKVSHSAFVKEIAGKKVVFIRLTAAQVKEVKAKTDGAVKVSLSAKQLVSLNHALKEHGVKKELKKSALRNGAKGLHRSKDGKSIFVVRLVKRFVEASEKGEEYEEAEAADAAVAEECKDVPEEVAEAPAAAEGDE